MLRSRIIYGLFLLFGLTFFILYNRPVAFAAFAAAVLLPVVMLISGLVSKKALRITQSLELSSLTKGDEVGFSLDIANRGPFFYPRIKICFFSENSFAVECAAENGGFVLTESLPLRKSSITLDLFCKYRGEYALGFNRAVIYDALGLFKFKRVLEPPKVKVYPAITDGNYGSLLSCRLTDEGRSQTVSDENYANVSDYRQYAPGDSMKRINWKLTARAGEFIVKNYETDSASELIIILDTSAVSGGPEAECVISDFSVESLISVANSCVSAGRRFRILFETNGLAAELTDDIGFKAVYEAVSFLRFGGDADLAGLIKNADIRAGNMAGFLFISHRLNDGLYWLLKDRALIGNEVLLINYCGPDSVPSLLQDLADAGIKCLGETSYES